MATADDIREEIGTRQSQVAQAKRDVEHAQRELREANERQRLRRELDEIEKQLLVERRRHSSYQDLRALVDNDRYGDHMPRNGRDSLTRNAVRQASGGQRRKGALDCRKAVCDGEIEWTLKGFSWLLGTLEQAGESYATSSKIQVGGHGFTLAYHPNMGEMGEDDERGSLVLIHEEPSEYSGAFFRYTVFIKSARRGFVQWGNGTVRTDNCVDGNIFGPDVCDACETPRGIFGMSYNDLLDSEWVFEDSLTAKLIVKVRPNVVYHKTNDVDDYTVPPPSLSDNLQFLLDNSGSSDVNFVVQGESIAAHSQILSARSDVFNTQFACGMQESVTKEVMIDDCDPIVFKAFLRFLYSDSFDCLDPYFDDDAAPRVSINDSSAASHEINRHEKLQMLLAISHRYQISRLQLWCEANLCKRISIEGVCPTLCQAHLFEAKQLEEKCLDFIKANMNDVVKTDSFGSLSQDWPQVSLKIILHTSSVPKNNALTAMEKQENARKRKREE